jgi:hypothetical protein
MPTGEHAYGGACSGCERVLRKEGKIKGVRFLYNGLEAIHRHQRRKHTMNTETMLARILPAIEELIKEVVSQGCERIS